jgi:hypothetical protein
MIPIRIPAGTPLPIVLSGITIGAGHPMAGAACPACDQPMDVHQRYALVYVGAHPDNRERGGAYWTGAAVAVHDDCALGGGEPAKAPACGPGEVLNDIGALARALGGERGGWRHDLLRLIKRSDAYNRRRLALAYPRMVRACELWEQLAPVPAKVLLAVLDDPDGAGAR